MSKPQIKVQIDNTQLLERMRRYEEVTGKQIGATMRRGARLLAVSLARSTQPYGNDSKAQQKGEIAVQNDILRVYRPAFKVKLKHEYNQWSFAALVHNSLTRDTHLRDSILEILGEASKRVRSVKAVSKRQGNIEALNAILRNTKAFSKIYAKPYADPSFYHRARNEYGRIRKGWTPNEVVTDGRDISSLVKLKQARVGMTKAAWAMAALQVNADVKNALSEIPAWVKRHIGSVPAAVVDNAESIAPRITLKNKLPWADKALREKDMKEAIRISREKFYNSMQKEIREALKAQKAS